MPKMSLMPLILGLALAALDALALPFVKISYTTHQYIYFVIALIASLIQIVVFYVGMTYTSVTVMNLIWDLMSDIMVTGVGLFILKEALSTKKMIGVALALLSMILMTSSDEI